MKYLRTAAVALAILVSALSSQIAHAGTMTVYSCHTPSGRIVDTGGWTLSVDNAALRTGVWSRCRDGSSGAMRLEVGRDGAHVDGSQEVRWVFRSADSTTISEFRAWVCGRAFSLWAFSRFRWEAPVGDPQSIIAYKSPDATPDTMGCQGSAPWWSSSANLVRAGNAATSWVEMTSGCAGICEIEPAVAAAMELGAFAATVEDGAPPIPGSPSGPLVVNRVHRGIETLSFPVTDRGVGAFRIIGEVRPHHEGPWLQFAESILGGSSCRPLGETAYLYEFASPQPCPTALSDASLTMDNTRLGAGTHDFRVSVEDAAGNRTVVMQSQAYEVADARSAQLRITSPSRRKQRSAGPFHLRGNLIDAEGDPIGGATLTVEARGYLPKSKAAFGRWEPLGAATTDPKGQYRFLVPGGASRTLRVTYDATSTGGASAVALADVIVPAQIKVRARRTRVRNGRSVVFVGHVAGPVPGGGLPVSLEAREPTRWVPAATTRRRVRTSATGKFTLQYRFRRTFIPTSYRFRVVSDEDSAFPYARGVSRTVTIRVRP